MSEILSQALISTYTRRIMNRVILLLVLLATVFSFAHAADRVWVLTVEGEIGRGTVSYLGSGLSDAEQGGAELVIVRLATPGGLLDSAFASRDLLLSAELPTVAFVDREALSAGALIALACESIVFAPGGVMGAATAFTFDASGEYVEAPEKTQSAVRTLFRATAEARDRDPTVAEAMVDATVEIPGLTEEGKLLTLTAQEAVSAGYADQIADSVDAFVSERGFTSAETVSYQRRLLDGIVEVMTSTPLAAILLVVGLLGLIVEMMIPGFGIAGIIGALCLGGFFWSHVLVGLAGWESLVFVIGGFLAIIFEIFVFTAADFGFAGVVGLVLIGLGFYTSMVGPFTDRGEAVRAIGIVSAGVVFSIVVAAILIGKLPKSRLRLGGVILSSAIGGTAFDKKGGRTKASEWVGRRGTAVTDLHPVGMGEFGAVRIDVVCEEGHLPKGTPLLIVKDEGYRKVVRRIKED
ncbi:nodulation protein NfeD [Candidatus Bipolaricaulota bacterium]